MRIMRTDGEDALSHNSWLMHRSRTVLEAYDGKVWAFSNAWPKISKYLILPGSPEAFTFPPPK